MTAKLGRSPGRILRLPVALKQRIFERSQRGVIGLCGAGKGGGVPFPGWLDQSFGKFGGNGGLEGGLPLSEGNRRAGGQYGCLGPEVVVLRPVLIAKVKASHEQNQQGRRCQHQQHALAAPTVLMRSLLNRVLGRWWAAGGECVPGGQETRSAAAWM